MSTHASRTRRLILLALPLLSILFVRPISPQARTAQQNQKQVPDHTIRVNVGLVQTDVMVFDRNGHFVPDLKMDQFELWVDGKAQPISFMEMVSAGSRHDEEVWAREEGKPAPPPPAPSTENANPGRTLVFFLDDWHMDVDHVIMARAALEKLINTSVGPKDRMAVFAASGQLGSAQQLTSEKDELLARVGKFNFQSAGVQDLQSPPMTEGQAFLIEQGDKDVIAYFAIAMQKVDPFFGSRGMNSDPTTDPNLVREIQHRAALLAEMSAGIGSRTLSALRNLIASCASLPGRKLIFFLSDGFVLQPQRGDIADSLRQMTIAAARQGILIYSLDTRGLVVGLPDAKTKRPPDTKGNLAHSGYNKVLPQQDALNALASDTGGRFLKNTNALDTAMITTISEISRYYLLAWPFDPDTVKPGKYSTIRAAVKGRSDLTVRVRQGSLDLSQLVTKKEDRIEVPGEITPATAAPPKSLLPSEMEIYQGARSVVDLSREELFRTYATDLKDLEFEDNQDKLGAILEKVGANVAAFFNDFPNTVSTEHILRQSLNANEAEIGSVNQSFNYSVSSYKSGAWDEFRTDSSGHTSTPARMPGFNFLTSGFAGTSIYFHPSHQFGSRFRYLGRERSKPNAYLIAFAQRPGITDVVGHFDTGMPDAKVLMLVQGIAWVDPETYQILRMRTDLLAPRRDVFLDRASSEIRFGEVRFKSFQQGFWLPQEVVVTMEIYGQLYRNRHRYSDYQVLTVAAQDKIQLPVIKK